MTTRTMLSLLTQAGCRPAVEGGELVLNGNPAPDDLIEPLCVLHTGVRAALTGRRWFGVDPKTGKACGPKPKDGAGLLAFGALDLGAKLPPNVGLLCVEGDLIMDRISHIARMDLPYLFAPEPERGRGR